MDYDLSSGMPIVDEALWRQLSPLLDRALDLPAGERAAFVESLRAETPELAAALARLLADHDHAVDSAFLETLAEGESVPSLSGTALGAYTLSAPLGAGGMGAVWRARRSDGRFEGDVAIKLLHPALLGPDGEARFRREGTILSRLTHPGIARLFDAGISPAGQPYLVLELVEGTRLDRHADARRLDVRARLELFLQVADAVSHAHASLVVHRDLKPSNILVDRDGRVKLLDFGIATLLAEGDATRTATMARAFTPEYAAPEQLDGRAITTATDVYALGVLLYELLTGVHPTLRGESTPAALVRAVLQTEPARMSESVARGADSAAAEQRFTARAARRERLVRQLAGDLDTIVARVLKKEPHERYPSVAALADDLRRHLRHQPVSARPDSAWYRLRKLLVRRRLEAGAAAVVALALLAATAIAFSQARSSARERDRALQELQRAEVTNDFSAFLLSGAIPPGGSSAVSELLTSGERVIDQRFADDPALRSHLLLLLADRYEQAFDSAGAHRAAERAFGLTRGLEDVRLRAAAGCFLAKAVALAGEGERADTLLAEAFAELRGEPDSAKEEAYCRLAESDLAYHRGEIDRSIRAGERALALERTRRGPPGRALEILNELGMAYGTARRYADSDRSYQELFALFTAQGRERTLPAALCRSNWAISLQQSGRTLRSVEEWEQAMAIARGLGLPHGATPYDLPGLAYALSLVGRQQEALAAAEEALTAARGGSKSSLLRALGAAARVHAAAGDRQAAAARLAEVDGLVAVQPSFSTSQLALHDRNRALAAVEAGDAISAVRLAAAGLAKLEAASRPAEEQLPLLLVLARAENDRGAFDAALAAAHRGEAMARTQRGDAPHSRELGVASLELGRALAGRGERGPARAVFEAAAAELRATVGERGPEYGRAVARRAELER